MYINTKWRNDYIGLWGAKPYRPYGFRNHGHGHNGHNSVNSNNTINNITIVNNNNVGNVNKVSNNSIKESIIGSIVTNIDDHSRTNGHHNRTSSYNKHGKPRKVEKTDSSFHCKR